MVPVYNVEQFLEECLTSILSQSYHHLRVIIVDDGSTDRSPEIARAVAAGDRRCRIVRKVNGGLGAARNTGVEHAAGKYLVFADSDDVVPAGSYAAMVAALEKSGSDFAVGAFTRGDEQTKGTPVWVARTHAEDRLGLRIEDHPEMLLDITAWNKMFRREFWSGQSMAFPEGVRYEDQVPITKALLTTPSFDVLAKSVYHWRTRDDGTSITQQKSTISDLRDRITSQIGCLELVRAHGSDVITEMWFEKVLVYDMPDYSELALSATQDYWELLSSRLHAVLEEAPPSAFGRVRLYRRLATWAIANDRHDVAECLGAHKAAFASGWPFRMVGDQAFAVLPSEDGPLADIPGELLAVEDCDVRPRARVLGAGWEGDDVLVVTGLAFLANLDPSAGPHRLEVQVRDPATGAIVPGEVERRHDPDLNRIAGRPHEDHAGDGFVVRFDVRRIVASSPAQGTHDWVFEVEHRQGAFVKVRTFTSIDHGSSVAFREPKVVDDTAVQLVGSTTKAFRIRVSTSYAVATEAWSEPGEHVTLQLDGPESDPVESVRARQTTGSKESVLESVSAGSAGRLVTVEPRARPATVWARHRSGRKSRVLCTVTPEVLEATGHEPHVFTGPNESVILTAPTPAVVVDSISALPGDRLLVTGRSLGAAGCTLGLDGPRAGSDASVALPEGAFEVACPTTADLWKVGVAPVPHDRYLLLASAGDKPVEVRMSDAMRRRAPEVVDVESYRWRVGTSSRAEVVLSPRTLKDEADSRRQQQLRVTTYAEARRSARLDAVLFETFNGRTIGDSPAAICAELHRRDLGLDLVWSVEDHSVPPPEGARSVARYTEEWYELLGRARYLVSNNNFPQFFSKAPGQVYLQTWHGTPLKKIGHDIVSPTFINPGYMQMMDAEAASWDYLISPSAYCTEIFPRAFAYDGEILESGYPRNDALASESGPRRREEVRRNLDIPPDSRVVLYAPTWREDVRRGNNYARTVYLEADRLTSACPDVVVLLRGHANTAKDSAGAPADPRILDVTLYPEVSDLFLAADILVTDYSSVMFDFAVLDRPILLLTPDLKNYREKLRGFYFDLEAESPGPLFSHTDEVIDAISNNVDQHSAARKAFRTKFAPKDDGHAAQRVVDLVFDPDKAG